MLRSADSPPVMADQLTYLLTFTDEPSVTVRVIRLATARPVLGPSFGLLSFSDAADLSIACVESIRGEINISRRAAEIQTIHGMFEALNASALPPADSARLISKYADRNP